ncbi:MAG: M48 family metallopeptidase [Clostridia bacterium]|nr:M48 family metallopeptidase [Clostridia bacterium]MDD4047250.1 M48 family metallopeptidase [Clostridia bacterium]
MEDLPRIKVEYKDKKNSSGKIVNGVICLSISSRLLPHRQEEHINKLTDKLVNKMNWAQRYDFDGQESPVKNDSDLLYLAETINKSYYKVFLENATFHEQKSSWGTCSLKTKQIYISTRLIGAPMELLWYVVTHELCHLAEPSHNSCFWELVSKACPNYVECRNKLKAFGMQ